MKRNRLTFAQLSVITARRRYVADKERTPLSKVEIIIPHMCWMDLRMDREMFSFLDFAMTTEPPKHIMYNGIRCVIEQYPGELVAMFEE